jgi:hypothetical protein
MFDKTLSPELILSVTLNIVNSSAYIANFSTNGYSRVDFASFNRIIIDRSVANMNRDIMLNIDFEIGTNNSTSKSLILTPLSPNSIFIGVNAFQL